MHLRLYLIDFNFFAVVNKNVDKMEPPIEENVVKKEKSLTARILSSAVCIYALKKVILLSTNS